MLVRIAAGIAGFLVLFCAFFIRSESGLDYIPIRYTMYKYEKYDVFRRAAGRRFQEKWNKEHPDRQIRVFYEPIGGDYATKLNTEVVANTVQDLFFVPAYFKFAKQGTLLDLTPFIEKNNDWPYFREIYPVLINSLMIDGKLYGVPNNLNTDILYYNKTLFRKAGVPFPDETWDWNKMLEAAKKLTVRDAQGRVLQYGLIPNLAWWKWIIWNGGHIWSEDGNRCVVNSPEAVEALQFLVDLVFKYRVSPTPKEQRTQKGSEAFQNNRAAMFLGGRWWTAIFWELTDVDWSIAPLPKSFRGIRRNEASFNIMGIYSKTRYPDIAYEFLKYLASHEEIKHLVEVGDSIPIRWKPEYNKEFLNEPRSEPGVNKAYLIAMRDAYTRYQRFVTNPDIPQEEFNWLGRLVIEKCFLGEYTPEEALARLQEGLQKKLAEYRSPPKTAPVLPYAIGFALVVMTAVPGAWLYRRNRSKIQEE